MNVKRHETGEYYDIVALRHTMQAAQGLGGGVHMQTPFASERAHVQQLQAHPQQPTNSNLYNKTYPHAQQLQHGGGEGVASYPEVPTILSPREGNASSVTTQYQRTEYI